MKSNSVNNNEINNILLKIEELRMKLHKLSETKGIFAPEVYEASKSLDEALNEYEKIVRKREDF